MNQNPKLMTVIFVGVWVFLAFFFYDLYLDALLFPQLHLHSWPAVAIWYGIFVAITKFKTKKPINVYEFTGKLEE